MRVARELFGRLRSLMRVRAADAELDEEVRFHIDMETQKLISAGLSPADAKRRARIAFGAVERFREESREQRGIGWIEPIARELRLSLRRLMREPGFTGAAVATLSVGFGVAMAVFALVDAVLLSSLPYPAADRLVKVGHTVAGTPVEGGLSDGLAAWYADESTSFELFGTVLENEVSLTDQVADADVAERVRVAMLSPELLPALARAPALGRFSSPDVEAGGSGVLISWNLWQRRYGGDAALIGSTIETNRRARTVIGVMPRDFDFPRPDTDVWMTWPRDDARADLHDLYLTGIARLRPGVSTVLAERELEALLARVPERYPDASESQLRDARLRVTVQSLKEARVADVRAPLGVLLVLVGFVMVIALANVLNLVVLRGERQRGEVVIARALGAGPGTLVRRVVVESFLLSVLAGILGVTIAAAAVALRFGFEPGAIPRLHEVAINGRVVAACMVLVVATSLLLAFAAWLRVGRYARGGAGGIVGPTLALTSRVTAGRSARRTQHALVGVQVALAFVLLVACATTVQSLQRLLRVQPGFDPTGTVIFELSPPARQYLSYGAVSALHATIRDELQTLPGVERVEGAFALPLQSRIQQLRQNVAAKDGATSAGSASAAPSSSTPAVVNMVTPGYFDALSIGMRAGRSFETRDLTAATPGVILGATLARDVFRGDDPVGRTIVLTGTAAQELQVVGVAEDVVGESLSGGPASVLYLPAIFSLAFDPEFRAQLPYTPRELTVIIRTTLPAASVAGDVRRVLARIDRRIPVVGLQDASRLVERATARARLVTLLLGIASAAALFLGAVGLWGVVAYTLAQRRSELAIRIAVGARPHDVVRLVLRQALAVAVVGAIAGASMAVVLTRSLTVILFQAEAAGPFTLAAAAALLLAVALAACFGPARHALRVDPAALLRCG